MFISSLHCCRFLNIWLIRTFTALGFLGDYFDAVSWREKVRILELAWTDLWLAEWWKAAANYSFRVEWRRIIQLRCWWLRKWWTAPLHLGLSPSNETNRLFVCYVHIIGWKSLTFIRLRYTNLDVNLCFEWIVEMVSEIVTFYQNAFVHIWLLS